MDSRGMSKYATLNSRICSASNEMDGTDLEDSDNEEEEVNQESSTSPGPVLVSRKLFSSSCR